MDENDRKLLKDIALDLQVVQERLTNIDWVLHKHNEGWPDEEVGIALKITWIRDLLVETRNAAKEIYRGINQSAVIFFAVLVAHVVRHW